MRTVGAVVNGIVLAQACEERPMGVARKTVGAADIVCCCSGASLVRMPELQSSFWLSEIEVEELAKDQIEGVRFRLRQFGGGCFEVLCATIKLSLQQDPLT